MDVAHAAARTNIEAPRLCGARGGAARLWGCRGVEVLTSREDLSAINSEDISALPTKHCYSEELGDHGPYFFLLLALENGMHIHIFLTPEHDVLIRSSWRGPHGVELRRSSNAEVLTDQHMRGESEARREGLGRGE